MTQSNAAYRAQRIEGLLKYNRYPPAVEASMKKDLENLRTEVDLETLESVWNKASKEARSRFIDRVTFITWELK